MKCYTYATHENFGLWRLVHNPYITIHVLGMGKPWINFMARIKAYYEVCCDANDEEILVFVDGFDSEILLPEKEIIERFLNKETRVLFGIDYHMPESTDSLPCKLSRCCNLVFHETPNDTTINCGVCIGFASELRTVWYEILKYSDETACYDDQRALNILYTRGTFPFMGVDTSGNVIMNVINCCRHRIGEHPDTAIVQSPGTFSRQRFMRVVDEHYDHITLLHNPFCVANQDTIKDVIRSVIDAAFTFYNAMAVDPVIAKELITKVSVVRYSGIDTIRHTALFLNEKYVFEKTILYTGLVSVQDFGHCFKTTDVPFPDDYPPTTIFEFVDRVRQYIGPISYYSYSVTRNNCQHFVRSALRANGLYTNEMEVQDVIGIVRQWTNDIVRNSIMPLLNAGSRLPW